MQRKKVHTLLSTGLPGLDTVFQGVDPGDNIVFQVDSIPDYVPFVHPFCIDAQKESRKLIYFRFADHEWLLPDGVDAEVFHLHPEIGFESFLSEIFKVIETFGVGACYVFDCLSELAVDWYSDRMLGNFFMLTCPYLYDFETATYFALLRNHHATVAINAIHNTAQVVLDVYNHRDDLYIHPLKVWKRHSPTMYTLHCWDGDVFRPVTRSTTIAEILTNIPQPWLDSTVDRPDIWSRTFAQARELVCNSPDGRVHSEADVRLKRRLIRMVVTREEIVFDLAEKFFNVADLLDIGRRMIGTGLIGGKSVGMLLAQSILKHNSTKWVEKLEAHDSFFIGSDVFYTFLVVNGCWWVSRRQRGITLLLDGAEEARQRITSGGFPRDIEEQCAAMLDYFGQSPIIVRSSSLLEDAYGNAFSGKYESVFCVNQGTPAERLESFMNAVRTVYAGTMSRDALSYRAQRGLLERDEQMALLVQRVSGEQCHDYFYPHVAGVGFSFNPYVWSSEIDPKQGMMRLVFGLGTRAVDRSDDDYTRVVALNAPGKRPDEGTSDDKRKYSQRYVDLLDLSENALVSRSFQDAAQCGAEGLLPLFAGRDEDMEERARQFGKKDIFSWVLTFEGLFGETPFVTDIRDMLQILHKAYDHAVDVEFTANFTPDKDYRIGLVQCRPFQAKGNVRVIESLPELKEKDQLILRTRGPIIGTSVATDIDRLIYVVPEVYSKLGMSQRYSVARLVGKLTHSKGDPDDIRIMLVGPGRWGTTTPSLGVPVSFSEINSVSVLCELALMHEGLVPDVSLGTHFFNDLVEMDMLYCAVYPSRDGHDFHPEVLRTSENRASRLVRDIGALANTVIVIEGTEQTPIRLYMNAMKQDGMCYLENVSNR